MYAFKMTLNGCSLLMGPEGQLGGCDHHSSQVTPLPCLYVLPQLSFQSLAHAQLLASAPLLIYSSLYLSLSLMTQKLPPDSLPGAFSEETSLEAFHNLSPSSCQTFHSLVILTLHVLPWESFLPGQGVREAVLRSLWLEPCPEGSYVPVVETEHLNNFTMEYSWVDECYDEN